MIQKGVTTLGAGIITAIVALQPSLALGATATVQTNVLIPQGNGTCPSPTISGITPHVYNNELHSFEMSVSDASYVAVIGAAGETGIPLRYMKREIAQDGSLKIHADLSSTRINGALNVSVTLLSSAPNQPTCITVVSFPVAGLTSTVQPTTPAPSTPNTTTVPAQSEGTVTTDTAPSTSGSSTAASSAVPVVGTGIQSALSRLCAAAGPYQLWFVLLALFMVAIGLVAFAEPPLTRKSTELPAALILIPLVLLLAFWYITPECRVAIWIPLVLIAAAAVALLAAYREKTPIGKILSVPEATLQTTPKITTMPRSGVPMKPTQTMSVTTTKTEQTKTIITPPPKKW